MHLSIDCRFVGKSGIGTYIENIVRILLRDHPENRYLLITDTDRNWFHTENVEVQIVDIKPFSVKEIIALPVEKINKTDAFFSPYINIPGRIKVPIFSTIHDVIFFDVDGLVSPIGKIMRRFFFNRAIKLSSKIFTVSQFSKERILHHFPTKKEIIVTYNGIPQQLIDNKKQSQTVKQDYFIFVGNIKKHKGLHTLIKAFADAKNKGLTSSLVIVGKNENFRTSDDELATLLQNVSGIEFTGWVTNEKLIQLISEAKALVQPSVYEGFGIPPLEALYLGTNVILSDIQVFKEIYDGLPVTFFNVNNNDDLLKKMLDFQVTEIPHEVTDLLIEKFSYQYVASKILKSIENVVI